MTVFNLSLQFSKISVAKNVKMSELSNVFKCHLCLHLPGFSNKKSTSQKHHSFSQDLLGSPDNFIKTAPSPERSSNASKRERSSASNNLPTKTGGIHYPETNSPLLKIDHPKRKCQGNIIFQPLISLSIRGHESWVDPVKSERYLTGEVQTISVTQYTDVKHPHPYLVADPKSKLRDVRPGKAPGRPLAKLVA